MSLNELLQYQGRPAYVIQVNTPSFDEQLNRYMDEIRLAESSFTGQRRQETLNDLDETYEDCRNIDWDSEGAAPLKLSTYVAARDLIDSLPDSNSQPGVFVFPTGRLGIRWVNEDNSATLLSLDEGRNLTWSIITKNGERKQGNFVYLGSLPSDVTESIL